MPPRSKKPKTTQRRLLPLIAAIKEDDDLAFADLAPYLYRCTCGSSAETQTPLPAVRCARCGGVMLPVDAGPL